MTIESTDILETLQAANRSPQIWPKILGTIITLTVITLFLLFVISPAVKPTGSLLSPLPEGEIVENPSPIISPTAVIVAAPRAQETTSQSAASATTASAEKLLISLPAGTRELVIRNHAVTSDSYIYLTPVSAVNDPVFVKTKGEGYFVIATAKAPAADLLLEYYLITN